MVNEERVEGELEARTAWDLAGTEGAVGGDENGGGVVGDGDPAVGSWET